MHARRNGNASIFCVTMDNPQNVVISPNYILIKGHRYFNNHPSGKQTHTSFVLLKQRLCIHVQHYYYFLDSYTRLLT